MYVNFLSTYSVKKSCHTSTTLQTSTRGLSAIAELLVIISYFSFGFISAYNSILFCCLRRNVKRCCHTYDLSWLCIVQQRAWSLCRWRTTETMTLSCLVVEYPQYMTSDIIVTTCEMVAAVHRRPCLQHLACCSVNSRQAQNRDFCLPHLHSTPPWGGFPSE